MNNSKRKYFTALNVAKGIIIWFAVILHAKDFFGDSIRAFDINNNWLYLIINPFFYMSSGFGLIYAYRDKVKNIGFFSFIWKRIKKIYPMYLLTTIIMLFFTAKADGWASIKFFDVIQNILMMTSGWFRNIVPYNIPAWFFSVLLLMYILFWTVERLFEKKDTPVYIILAISGLILLFKRFNIPFLYYENGLGIFAFSTGALIGIFFTEKCMGSKGEMKVFVLALTLTILSAAVMIFWGYKEKQIWAEFIFSMLIAPATLLWTLIGPVNHCVDLVFGLANLVGKIAMNVYLWHLIIVRVYNAVCLKIGVYDLIGLRYAYIAYLIITFLVCLLISRMEKYGKKSYFS